MTELSGSFVTVGRGFVSDGYRVQVKDSKLLSPAGGGLAELGSMFDMPKIYVADEYKSNMSRYRAERTAEFYKYGARDALVPLLHLCSVEDFYQGIGEPGLPTTLSALGIRYVEHE